ncbi:MAG: MobA/MobL family protein [Clostridia bacterium]|nr:MobA/MobL family protein [Clostridia bacterium]
MRNLSLYHFHVTQIKRSAGQSAIASAAYRSGEKLYSQYYGETSDYTRKSGVVCSGILLPSHVPPEYADRETLWNAVEQSEKHPKAQLAYSFDIALQKEFTMEENIVLVLQFLTDHFVSRGMIADYAVHAPEKDGGISNPHFHVLCPIRPLNPDGIWGAKQKREYVLDEHGNKIRDGDGNYVFNAVSTTDWGTPETLEEWRQAWAELCNAKFAEKELTDRIDHRSYERQGVEKLPTIHEGPAVRQMEAKGIQTDKGSLNRMIRKLNQMRKNILAVLNEIADIIREIKEEMSASPEPMLMEIVMQYFDEKSASVWSMHRKLGYLKNMTDSINFLREYDLNTLADLEARRSEHQTKLDAKTAVCRNLESRMKEVENLLRQAKNYADTKPIYDKWYSMKFKGKKDKFKAEHNDEFRKYYAAERKLKEHFMDGKLPVRKWENELAALKDEFAGESREMKKLERDAKNFRLITLMYMSVTAESNRERQNKQHTLGRD